MCEHAHDPFLDDKLEAMLTKNRMEKLHYRVMEQVKTKPLESVEHAHRDYAVVLNQADYDFMRKMCWQLSPQRTSLGENRHLQIGGFDCWGSPTIPLGNPRLLTREEAAGVIGEFAEGVAGIAPRPSSGPGSGPGPSPS